MSLNVFISADIEGITGFVHPTQDETDEAARAMAADVNAALDGIFEIYPDATVVVADAHGRMRTIPQEGIDQRATLVRGRGRPYGMVDGYDETTDLAMFIGYHARPGRGGVLEHTFSGSLAEVSINGTPVGELELNASLLAHHDIPVSLVTGDDVLAETVGHRLPHAGAVISKYARGGRAAICRPPEIVREEIRQAASDIAQTPPPTATVELPLDTPIDVGVRFQRSTHAELASLWPEVELGEESRSVHYRAPDMPTAYRFAYATATVRPRDV